MSRVPALLVLAGMLMCAAAIVATPTGRSWIGDGSVSAMYDYCDGADIGNTNHHRWVNNHNWRDDVCGDARDQTRAAVALSAAGGAVAGVGGVWLWTRRMKTQRTRRVLLWVSPVLVFEAAAAAAMVPVIYVELIL